MKYISGFRTARYIRQLYEMMHVPIRLQPKIIGLIETPSCYHQKKAYYHGFDELLPKVIPLVEFSNIMKNAGMINKKLPCLFMIDD